MLKRIALVSACLLTLGFVAYSLDVHHLAKLYLTPAAALPCSADLDADLAGNYYFGDGLGVNQRLTLREDGTFHCDWSGCLGDYGSASGTWERGELLYVSTSTADGMFLRSPIENMTILVHDGKPHFLEDGWRSFIDEFGEDSIPDATFSPVKD